MPPNFAAILIDLDARERRARRRAVSWLVVCSLLLTATGATLLTLFVDSMTFGPCPSRWNQAGNDAQNLRKAAEQFMLENADRCPRDVGEMVRARVLSRPIEDPWGRPFTLTCLPDGITVCSTGPDADDPADDICSDEAP